VIILLEKITIFYREKEHALYSSMHTLCAVWGLWFKVRVGNSGLGATLRC